MGILDAHFLILKIFHQVKLFVENTVLNYREFDLRLKNSFCTKCKVIS